MSTIEQAIFHDGNNVEIPGDEIVFLSEGEEPFIFDADGVPLHKGDTALVLPDNDWAGRIVRVNVRYGNIYEGRATVGFGGKKAIGAIWPTSPHESVSIETITPPRGSSWAIKRQFLRKVDLSDEEGQRIMLSALHAERAGLDMQAARTEGERVRVSLEIRRLQTLLGEVG